MIELTTLKGEIFYLNLNLIYRIDQIPDTMITLADGKKLRVNETPWEIIERIRGYQQSICSSIRFVPVEALP
ncbi:MAG: flagellar FlbD family protein [Erysipelotrichaceae bacterium]|nr:flagellar FlbD family protein [Erysipelotrichaceae bacterium]